MFKREKRKIAGMKLIKTVNTEAEAVVVQGLLDSAGIEARLEYENDAGGTVKVVLGTTTLGVNIYVKEEDSEDALAILDAPEESE